MGKLRRSVEQLAPDGGSDTRFLRSDYDNKLVKIGHPELQSRQGSEAGTQHSRLGDDLANSTHALAGDAEKDAASAL